MTRSTDRILTTHIGSLPRLLDLLEMKLKIMVPLLRISLAAITVLMVSV
jgi:hypothetical protein